MSKTTAPQHIHLAGSLEPILMLHGFPAEPVKDPATDKNIDLAFQLNEVGHEVLLIHYNGLGLNRDGSFLFSSSISDSISAASSMLERSPKINLIGHSWGGYVSIILKNKFKHRINRTILLSPFVFLPDELTLKNVLRQLCLDVPYVLKGNKTSDDLTDDLIRSDIDYFKYKEEIIKELINTSIYHAIDDNEVPVESSQRICSLNPQIKMNLCPTDHSFKTNRMIVTNQIIREFL
jgi:pimeloyl-ACP methyl ester carboxylesterase